jgi:hypothetical protein
MCFPLRFATVVSDSFTSILLALFFPLNCFNISSILHQQLVLGSYYVIDCFFMEDRVFYFKVFHLLLTNRLWLVITDHLLAGFRNLPPAGVE